MARQCYPGGHCGAGQGGGLLEGQVAWQKHDCFFIEDRVFRQHSVEIGGEPVSQVVGLDRSAKPARMKAPGNPVANFDPSNPFAIAATSPAPSDSGTTPSFVGPRP
jgi:hypothetical protein